VLWGWNPGQFKQSPVKAGLDHGNVFPKVGQIVCVAARIASGHAAVIGLVDTSPLWVRSGRRAYRCECQLRASSRSQ
jgi:hypothetical protein